MIVILSEYTGRFQTNVLIPDNVKDHVIQEFNIYISHVVTRCVHATLSAYVCESTIYCNNFVIHNLQVRPHTIYINQT